MARQRAIAVLLLPLVCLTCVISFDEETPKNREKRSQRPFLPLFTLGRIAKMIPQVVQRGSKIAKNVQQFVLRNPEKVGSALMAGVAGAAVVSQPTRKRRLCQVPIKLLQEKQPVFFTIGNPDSLMIPENGNLTWDAGDTSWIACPPSDGSSNGISGKNRVSAVIECVLGFSFRYVHDFRPLLITEVSCDYRVTGNVRTSRVPDHCPGSYNAVGFYVPFPIYGHRFFDLYYICFDETNATPIYTHHTVYGNEIQYRCTTSFRPVFKVPGFPKNLDVTSAYSQYNQENRLTALFASDSKPRESAMEYFDENYLQKGHLTPHADGLFITWQWSSYFYINVVGMWERIYNGNWKFLEEKVRTIANATKQNLDIYTGAYDTLSLCSLQHYCNKFTLSNGRIPVPKWLWKIVKSPENNAAIALVVSNNPFVDEFPICGQGHESFGWNKNIVTGRTHGAVSYCSVQDLKRIVRNIPREALAPYILKVVYSNG